MESDSSENYSHLVFSNSADSLWPHLPASPVLASDEVHVWCVSLEQPAGHVPRLVPILSDDERARATRYRFSQDRDRFVVRRGVLRVVLGKYVDVEPGHIQFGYGPCGKPQLAREFNPHSLHFNLAHSDGLALYAFTRARKIGVDLERIRHVPDIEAISSHFFSAQEKRKLCELSGSARLRAFYNCWTRKEAYIKAVGDGLSQPLDQFEVSLEPGEPARLLSFEERPEEVTRWSLKSFAPVPGYVAALAVEGRSGLTISVTLALMSILVWGAPQISGRAASPCRP